MGPLPAGTVTFLFTDVEGSTAHASALGDEAWSDLLAEHRKLIRAAVAGHAGVELGVEGDAVFTAFSRAADAVTAAVEAQRRGARRADPPLRGDGRGREIESERLRRFSGSRRNWWAPDAAALVAAIEGAGDDARVALAEMIEIATQAPARPIDGILTTAAMVSIHLGDPATASTLLAAAAVSDGRRERLFCSRSPMGYALYRHCRNLVRGALPPDTARECRARGGTMTPVEAVALARTVAAPRDM